MQDRLALIAADLAAAWVPAIANGDYPAIPQDNEQATLAPKIDRSETVLRITGKASTEYNRFRAFTPAPGVFLPTRFGRLKLIQARLAEVEGTPGTIVALNPDIVLACAEGGLRLIEVQPEGKRPMDGRSWANGARLRIGDNLLA